MTAFFIRLSGEYHHTTDMGCSICYRGSNIHGAHLEIDEYEKHILIPAAKSNVFQIALGGGNPNQHPQFIEILKLTREKYNIIPSFSTNGRGLTKKILEASEEYCGAVALSLHISLDEIHDIVNLMSKYSLKINLHIVLTSESITEAIEVLKNKFEVLEKCNAIIFLNYKPVGEHKSNHLLLKNSSLLEKFFNIVQKTKHSFRIGFDSCMVPGILKYMKDFKIESVEPCEASRFSAFISEDLKMYPCSFMVREYEGADLRESSLLDIWLNDPLFLKIRSHLKGEKCFDCEYKNLCLNGCPFIEKINLCS